MNTESLTPKSDATTSDSSSSAPAALSQVAIVGAVTMTLAGVAFLVTLVLVLSLWMPAWVATLAMTVLLTATSLAVFASADPRSRLRGVPVSRAYVAFPEAPPSFPSVPVDAGFPVVPVSTGPQPAPVMDPAFQGTVIPASTVTPSSIPASAATDSVPKVEAKVEAEAIEAAEFEDALPENDEQETTVVRNVDRLMQPNQHNGFGQHVGLGQRTTRPMFQKSTQPSIGR